MKISGGFVRLVMGAAFCVCLMTVGGCTKYASPDDLKKLDETNRAAVSAERDLEQIKAERMKVERELAAKQKELEAAKAEFEKVKNQ